MTTFPKAMTAALATLTLGSAFTTVSTAAFARKKINPPLCNLSSGGCAVPNPFPPNTPPIVAPTRSPLTASRR